MSKMAVAAASLLSGNDPQIQSLSGAGAKGVSSQVALRILNESSVYATNVCQTNCTQLIENINVVISPGAYVGPITFTQSCQITDVNCAIDALVDEGIKTTLQSYENPNFKNQLPSKGPFGTSSIASKASQPLDEVIRNNFYQMVSSNCTFETNQVLSNNYVYVGTGATTGAISFAQTSTISATDCAIDVIAKNSAYTPDNLNKSNSELMLLIIVIVIVILVLGIIFVIVFLIGGGNKRLRNFFLGGGPKPLPEKVYKIADIPHLQVAPDQQLIPISYPKSAPLENLVPYRSVSSVAQEEERFIPLY